MTSKFDFYEIVKVISLDPIQKDINGKLGVIRGKAQNEITHEWSYGIVIDGTDGMVRRVYEKDLQYTGQKADPKDFESGESIKVKVDPKTGRGYLSDD
jgi:hypothetical protein